MSIKFTLSIIILFLILIMYFGYNFLKGILEELEWLRARFISKHERYPRLAEGINPAEQFEELAPLFYMMPFAHVASELRRMHVAMGEKASQAFWSLRRFQIRELESFAATNPSDDKAFTYSDNLRADVRRYAVALRKRNVVYKWEDKFRNILRDIQSGKLSIKDAKEMVEPTREWTLMNIDDGLDLEAQKFIDEFCNGWDSRLEATEWRASLDELHRLVKDSEANT